MGLAPFLPACAAHTPLSARPQLVPARLRQCLHCLRCLLAASRCPSHPPAVETYLNVGCWLLSQPLAACCCLHPACGAACCPAWEQLPSFLTKCPLASPGCRTDKEAATRRLSAVVPELEMLEATWGSMHGVCGAGSPEDLIQYWQGGWAALCCPLLPSALCCPLPPAAALCCLLLPATARCCVHVMPPSGAAGAFARCVLLLVELPLCCCRAAGPQQAALSGGVAEGRRCSKSSRFLLRLEVLTRCPCLPFAALSQTSRPRRRP